MSESSEGESGSAPADLAREASSRKRFLSMVGGAGAAGVLATFGAACGGDDERDTAGPSGRRQEKAREADLEIVNNALTLEYLAAELYAEVTEAGVVSDDTVAKAVKAIGEHEQRHVDALLATARTLGTQGQKPRADFRAVIDGGERRVLETAANVENNGAAA